MMTTAMSGRTLGAHGQVRFARGPSITDRGSVFTAQVAWPVKSAAAAHAAIAAMRQDSSCTCADHCMTAFRMVAGPRGAVEKMYDDDGEAHGGQRLLGCLTKLKAVNIAVTMEGEWMGFGWGWVECSEDNGSPSR